MPFPTEFPTAAASAWGNAILTRSFDRSLLEPGYDLQGYAMRRIISALPAPQPEPPTPAPAKVFGQGINDELTHEQIGHILVAAAHASEHGKYSATYGADADPAKALPWKTIFSVLFTILQGLLLSQEPPIVNPAKA